MQNDVNTICARHRHFCCALYVAIEVGLYLHPTFLVKMPELGV